MKTILFIATLKEAMSLLHALETKKLSNGSYLFDGGEIIICGMGPEAAYISAKGASKNAHWINVGIAGSTAYEQGSIVRVGRVARLENPLDYIVVDDEHLATLYTASCPIYSAPSVSEEHYVVDMEGFSIAKAARERGVSCSILKVVSDYCDEASHETILANLPLYSAKIRDQILASLVK